MQAANAERDRLNQMTNVFGVVKIIVAEFKMSEQRYRQETAVQLSTQKEKIRLQAITIEQLQSRVRLALTCFLTTHTARMQIDDFRGQQGQDSQRTMQLDEELFALKQQLKSQTARIEQLEAELAV